MRFENVYFINGTAYAGKSTLVRRLAEKHGGIACEENYHDALLPNLDANEFPAFATPATSRTGATSSAARRTNTPPGSTACPGSAKRWSCASCGI